MKPMPMMMSTLTAVVSPFSIPATSPMISHCLSSSQPRMSGVCQPNRSPPDRNGIVNLGGEFLLPGELVIDPPGSSANSSPAMNRATPGARMLIAKPLTMWLTPNVTVARACSRPKIKPPTNPPMRPIHQLKYHAHHPANSVPAAIIPSRPMLIVPLRSAYNPPMPHIAIGIA